MTKALYERRLLHVVRPMWLSILVHVYLTVAHKCYLLGTVQTEIW